MGKRSTKSNYHNRHVRNRFKNTQQIFSFFLKNNPIVDLHQPYLNLQSELSKMCNSPIHYSLIHTYVCMFRRMYLICLISVGVIVVTFLMIALLIMTLLIHPSIPYITQIFPTYPWFFSLTFSDLCI